MPVQDIDVVISIWGKDIFPLKGNTTTKKKIPVTEDLIQVPKDLIKLHRDIVMTEEILFVNIIPFFLTLKRNFSLPWSTILRTGKSRKYTPPSMRCTSPIEIGDLGL